jgi:hypothetical protein
MKPQRPKRRWLQFSLRALLVFVTLFAIACSWVAVKMRAAREELNAAVVIEKMGGRTGWSVPSGPLWLRRLLGNAFFNGSVKLVAPPSNVADADLEHLKALQQLISLYLVNTKVTDAGLEHLQTLGQLQELHLDDTTVTDAGLKHLNALGQLQWLSLSSTKITDAGLEHLTALRQLKTLFLDGTKVTDAAVEKLQQAMPQCKIVK